MNKHVLAQTQKQLIKVAAPNIELVKEDDLVVLKDGLIQARELEVESSKRKKKIKKEEKNSAAKWQQYNIMTKIIN